MAAGTALSGTLGRKTFDAAVIGCGLVGAATARALAMAGLDVLIVEPLAPFSGASGNNSGIVCTGFDAAECSLERRALRGGRAELLALARRSLPSHAFHPTGSLIADFATNSSSPLGSQALSSAAASAALDQIVEECLAVDDVHARKLTASEVQIMEPGISPDLRAAALIPGEIVFDPFLLGVAILRSATRAGAQLLCGHAVIAATQPSCTRSADLHRTSIAAPVLKAAGLDWATNLHPASQDNTGQDQKHSEANSSLWELTLALSGQSVVAGGLACLESAGKGGSNPISQLSTTAVHASMVFNCAGNFGDVVQAQRSPSGCSKASWHSRVRPRRGQYVVTAPMKSTTPQQLHRPLQPLPSASTKGVYVFSPAIASGSHTAIVSGPTATDVPLRDAASLPDAELMSHADFGVRERRFAELCPKVERDLISHAAERVPSASATPSGSTSGSTSEKGWGVLGRYGGLRPAAEGRRDYAISHEGNGWWSVLGIRSTGASASLGIGRMVASGALAEAVCAARGPVKSSQAVLDALTTQVEAQTTNRVKVDSTHDPSRALRQFGQAFSVLQPRPSMRFAPSMHALQAASSPNAWRRQGRLALESLFWSHEEHARAKASTSQPGEQEADAVACSWPTVDLGWEGTGNALAKQSPGYDSTISSVESSSLALLAEMIEDATLTASESKELSAAHNTAAPVSLTASESKELSAAHNTAAPVSLTASEAKELSAAHNTAAPAPGLALSDDAFTSTMLHSEELISQFCKSLEQQLLDKKLDRSVLRRPAHLWPVTGFIHVDSMQLPVTHSLTKLLWAYQGGLLEPVAAGTDTEFAFDDSVRW